MTAEQLISSSTIHLESDPPAFWPAERHAVGCADVGVLSLDARCISWLAEYPVVSIPVCLGGWWRLDWIAGDVVAGCHYLMPLSG